ncbi:MAG: regulatory protein RecX, partial [Faecousia sp.]
SVSRRDLEERLVRKGEDPAQAKEAVAWMEDLHLVDDRETARQVVQSCIYKGYGPARAKQALYEKRIPKEYWEEALESYPDQTDRIEAFLRSRLDADADDKQVKRAVDALIRRGHSYSAIQRVLNTLSFDTEEFLED